MMPAAKTLGRGVNAPQLAAWEQACEKAGVTSKEGLEAALKLFVESQGVAWPETGKHGGLREGAFKRKGLQEWVKKEKA